MRVYVLALVLLMSGYAFSQAGAEGGMLNSLGSGAAASAGTRLSGSLDQAFGRASGQVGGSQQLVVPRQARRSVTHPANTPMRRPTVSNTGGVPAAKPATQQKPRTQSAANPPRKKSWEISTTQR